jgi:outer membrane protein
MEQVMSSLLQRAGPVARTTVAVIVSLITVLSLVALLVVLPFSSALFAQTVDPQATRITFGDAVRIALQQNISLKGVENAKALAAVSVAQQRNQFLPNLNFSTSGSDNIGQSFSQTVGQVVNRQSQALNAGVSSNVTLFNGFQNLSLLRQARFSDSASSADLARARQTVVFTVASNFLSLVTLQEQQGVQRENLVAQTAQLDQIQRMVTAGTKSIADLYQQQAAVALAQSTLVSATRAVELAKVDLIQTLKLDPVRTYDFSAPMVDSTSAAPTFTLEGLLASAFSERADLTAARTRVDQANAVLQTSSSTRWPSIAASLAYNTAYSSLADASLGSQLNQRKGGSVGLSLSIPIFDRGTSSIASQQAKIQLSNANLTNDLQRQTVALEVRRAYLDYQSALEQLNATRAQRKASDLALNAVQERYRVGAATLVELSLARAAQVSAASALVNARYTLIFQQSLMSYYTGTLDPANVVFGTRP